MKVFRSLRWGVDSAAQGKILPWSKGLLQTFSIWVHNSDPMKGVLHDPPSARSIPIAWRWHLFTIQPQDFPFEIRSINFQVLLLHLLVPGRLNFIYGWHISASVWWREDPNLIPMKWESPLWTQPYETFRLRIRPTGMNNHPEKIVDSLDCWWKKSCTNP